MTTLTYKQDVLYKIQLKSLRIKTGFIRSITGAAALLVRS